jgi:hypothetical protein
MAKKLIIDTTVNTEGIDKAVQKLGQLKEIGKGLKIQYDIDGKPLDIVLDKCSVAQNMFHSISTSFDEYGDTTWLKDMDKGHVAMHSPSWWLKKFNDKFVEKYFITTMSRTDFVSAEYQKYKFSNTVFMLTKESMSILAHL